MKGPGYMAVLGGEVIHIVRCVLVEVKIALTDETSTFIILIACYIDYIDIMLHYNIVST